jgi:glycosyltransferase involved in cell wall biosynthesis
MTDRNPLVSVIIPTYNYGHFLVQCLNSVFEQTEKNLEIIIVDDGSTDNTSDVVKRLKNDKIRYIFQENMGLSAARNTGLRYASGDFVQFLDSDDLLGSGAIAAKVNYLRQNHAISIAVSPNREFSEVTADGKPQIKGCWRLHRRNLDVHLAYLNIAPPHAFLIRRTAVEHVGYFDKSLKACEDYDYWLRAAALGYAPHFCGERTIVYYRRHPGSMSANRKNQYYHDVLLHHRVLKLLLSHSKTPVSQNHWLAFMAGILTTLTRLELVDDPILDDLVALFLKALQDAGSFLPPVFESLDSPGLNYWFLVRRQLRQLAKFDDVKFRQISDASDSLNRFGIHTKATAKDLLRIIQGWRHDPLDMRNFARALIR